MKTTVATNGGMIVDSHIQRVGNSGLFIGVFIGIALPPTGGAGFLYTAVHVVPERVNFFVLLVSPSSSQWDQTYPSWVCGITIQY